MAGGKGVGVGWGARCREMGPNFSMIFDLFFICNEAARQEKVDSASECFLVSSLDEDLWKSVFHYRDRYLKCKGIFSLLPLPLILDLPNTRYYSVD